MSIHFPFIASIIFSIIFFSTTLPQSNSQKNDTFSICSQSYFTCGTLTNVSFPFWGTNRPNFCGNNEFKLTCMHSQNTTSIQIGSQKFNILNINQTSSTMKMVRTDLVYDFCSSNFTNTSLNGSPFTFLPTVQNVTIFYDCPIENSSIVGNIQKFTCVKNGTNRHAFYLINNETKMQGCGVSVEVQVSKDVVWDSEGGIGALNKALDEGFDVKYDEGVGWSSKCTVCRESGGTCGTNQNDSAQFSCYCPAGSGTHAAMCPAHKSMSFFPFFSSSCIVV